MAELARITKIADAIVAELKAGSWGMELDSWREYVTDLTRNESHNCRQKNLSILRVPVIPAKRSSASATRALSQYDHVIEVSFYKLVAKRDERFDKDQLDALVATVERIEAFFSDQHRLTGFPSARAMEGETDPIFDNDLLKVRNVFASNMLIGIQDHG